MREPAPQFKKFWDQACRMSFLDHQFHLASRFTQAEIAEMSTCKRTYFVAHACAYIRDRDRKHEEMMEFLAKVFGGKK